MALAFLRIMRKNNSASGIVPMLALALAAVPPAFAQEPSGNSPAPPTPTAPGETAPSGPQQVQLGFSPWTRYCAQGLTEKSSQIGGKKVCFTASDGHLPSGQKLVIALLIEPDGESEAKLLRITLPLGISLVPGARVVIDDEPAMTAPFTVCLPKNGCMADYKTDAELIAKLKTGHTLTIQAFEKEKPVSFSLPLADFAKAYDGPPSDPTRLNGQ